jgi:hypothetical protein
VECGCCGKDVWKVRGMVSMVVVKCDDGLFFPDGRRLRELWDGFVETGEAGQFFET